MATSVEWTHCQKALPPLGFWQRVLSPSPNRAALGPACGPGERPFQGLTLKSPRGFCGLYAHRLG